MNNNQDIAHGSLQSQAQNFKMSDYSHTGTITVANTLEDNTYGLLWTPEEVTFMVNDVVYYKFNRDLLSEYNPQSFPWTKPFYLILNIAIGGSAGGTVDATSFPQSMVIKSIKLWDLGFENFSLNNNYNSSFKVIPPVSNILLQSQFADKNIIGWKIYVDNSIEKDAQVLFNPTTSTLDAVMNNNGTANYMVQIYYPNLSLVAGNTYEYEVEVSSTLAREIGLGIQNNGVSNPTPYFVNNYNLEANATTTLTGTYIATETKDTDSFILYLGSPTSTPLAEHTVSVKNITITDLGADALTCSLKSANWGTNGLELTGNIEGSNLSISNEAIKTLNLTDSKGQVIKVLTTATNTYSGTDTGNYSGFSVTITPDDLKEAVKGDIYTMAVDFYYDGKVRNVPVLNETNISLGDNSSYNFQLSTVNGNEALIQN